MITNEREYKITKASAEQFRLALEQFDELAALKSGLDPLIVEAQKESLESQYDELVEQLREYERMRSGEVRDLSGRSFLEIGQILINARVAEGLSQKQLANRLDLKQQQIQRYEADEFRTASLRRLEEIANALNLSVSLKVEIKGESRSPLTERAPTIKGRNIDIKKLPTKVMKKRGWLDEFAQDKAGLGDEMLVHAFMAEAFQDMPSPALYRQNIRAHSTVDFHALMAWQGRILLKARKLVSVRRLGESILSSEWLSDLVKLSEEDDGPLKAIDFLWERGIVVVTEPHLPKTFIDGAAMLLDRKVPVLGLTLRHDRLDNFWFVLLHELGHIFKHRRRGLDVGFFDEDTASDDDPREAEANEFAQRALIPDEIWKTTFVRYTNSPDEIRLLASKLRVGPWIVAGRIRRERENYKVFGELVGAGRVREQFKLTGLYGER